MNAKTSIEERIATQFLGAEGPETPDGAPISREKPETERALHSIEDGAKRLMAVEDEQTQAQKELPATPEWIASRAISK